jgi:AhpD family alkylhydroperoxidase
LETGVGPSFAVRRGLAHSSKVLPASVPNKHLFILSLLYSKKLSLTTDFNDYRQRMNERVLSYDNKVIKRFFNLDTNTYAAGAIDVKTKEMLGLACSLVLRCDDCVKYHLGKCHEEGLTDDEVFEVFSIANLIGGSIVIPHFRRAVEYWEVLRAEAALASPTGHKSANHPPHEH